MAKVIIFGIKDFAELAWYYLKNDSPHDVVAFTVNRDYLPPDNKFHDLPVLPFEDLIQSHPAPQFQLFAPMSPKGMNKPREEIYDKIKAMGYTMVSYISSKVTMFDNVIGDNCFILEDNTIQPFTRIGNNVVLWSGNHIGHHGLIEDHVSFTSHVVMSGHVRIGKYSFLGVNATLRDGIELAEGTLVGMGAVVSKSTEPWGVYIGNPAKILENKKSTSFL
jgi:sugar O-acyltransferase (sialic acid O-acetyltransferase NeuD family)